MAAVYEKALRIQATARDILKDRELGLGDDEALISLSEGTLSLLGQPIADGMDAVACGHTLRQVAFAIITAAEEPRAVIDLAVGLLRGLDSQLRFHQSLWDVNPEGLGLFEDYKPDILN
jgi:hypothetical protein